MPATPKLPKCPHGRDPIALRTFSGGFSIFSDNARCCGVGAGDEQAAIRAWHALTAEAGVGGTPNLDRLVSSPGTARSIGYAIHARAELAALKLRAAATPQAVKVRDAAQNFADLFKNDGNFYSDVTEDEAKKRLAELRAALAAPQSPEGT